jgi:hypothetical protein
LSLNGGVVEARAEHVGRCLEVLRAAVDAFEEAAFLVTPSGVVLLSSPAARALDPGELERVQRSLVRAIAVGSANAPPWELLPLLDAKTFVAFLAVLRAPLRD